MILQKITEAQSIKIYIDYEKKTMLFNKKYIKKI